VRGNEGVVPEVEQVHEKVVPKTALVEVPAVPVQQSKEIKPERESEQ